MWKAVSITVYMLVIGRGNVCMDTQTAVSETQTQFSTPYVLSRKTMLKVPLSSSECRIRKGQGLLITVQDRSAVQLATHWYWDQLYIKSSSVIWIH